MYGKRPYSVVLVHGGPGAAGEMAPVAVELSSEFGVLEPLQRAKTIEGQIEELAGLLESTAHLPCFLVGYSWGAWLSFMTTAYYPDRVRKLVLVGCGPFAEKYALNIHRTRISRLDPEEKAVVETLIETLDKPELIEKDKAFARLGEILSIADAFEPLSLETEEMEYRFDIFKAVWAEAEQLRRSGALLALAKHIKCPVVAIHGDHDPHPAEGVEKPLSAVLRNFRFFLLQNCGHKPWNERRAKDRFFSLLRKELNG